MSSLLTSRDRAEETPGGNLPSMKNALRALADTETSFCHSVQYLITQTAICAPSIEETILSILEPLRDVTIDFLTPVHTAWSDIEVLLESFSYTVLHDSMPNPAHFAENHDSMRLHAQHARGISPLLDTTITNIEGPLIAELRGSYGLEPVLCTFKWLRWSSSMQ
ncbi:hypothetical protein ARMGADRAFT_1171783, partial [Armillaria gallica]